jgi:hypothetical protein
MVFTNESVFQNNPIPTFRLTDETLGRVLVDGKRLVGRGEETVIVDGMLTNVYNDSTVDVRRTWWSAGQSNTKPKAILDPSFATVNVRYPADYEIRFSDRIVDTSVTGLFFGAPAATPTRFTVWNLTENRKEQFMFYDTNGDSVFSVAERISLVHGDSLGKHAEPGNYRVSWRVTMEADTLATTQRLPGPGDVLSIELYKPFRTGETFEFTMKGESINPDSARTDLDKVAVVPNPYVGAASWEPPNLFRSGRGERRIYFINLPAQCTIRIYTVRGYLVQTIEHNGTAANGQESWNLVSKDGMDIAYGMYVYHIDAPGIGQKISRFAIIK